MLLRTQSNHDFGKFLKDSEYMDLIGILLVQCNLNYHTLEIFKKLYGMHECDILLNEIKRAKGMLTYRWGEDGIEIYAPEFFIDIVIHPLSQFHSMVSMSYEQFVNVLEKLPKDNLFLQATSPSLFTQFAQYWVAKHLGINKTLRNILVR
jgi:hypothetical protein